MSQAEIDLQLQITALKVALQDAIKSPEGVIPDTAKHLLETPEASPQSDRPQRIYAFDSMSFFEFLAPEGTDPEVLLKDPALRMEFARDILSGYCEFDFQYTKVDGNEVPWDEKLEDTGETA